MPITVNANYSCGFCVKNTSPVKAVLGPPCSFTKKRKKRLEIIFSLESTVSCQRSLEKPLHILSTFFTSKPVNSFHGISDVSTLTFFLFFIITSVFSQVL